jgi:cell division transport system permease protein
VAVWRSLEQFHYWLSMSVFKLLTKSDYLLRETLLGLRRGGWMNWAAVSTVTVLLFLFGISLQTSWQLGGLLNQFGSQLEVSVYLETGVQAQEVQAIVAAVPGVASVTAVPKEAVWAKLTQEMGLSDIRGVTDQLDGNPLVDELKVKAAQSETVPAIAARLKTVQGVEKVQYIDEAVRRISQLNRGLNWVSAGLTALLSLTAIAVVTTTIRLIVMARRREIEVMQLVGATTDWIYLPFILQGLLLGIIGAGIAWGLIMGLQAFVESLLAQQPEFIAFLTAGMRLSVQETILLPLALLGLGIAVGLLGSLFAVRRFAIR